MVKQGSGLAVTERGSTKVQDCVRPAELRWSPGGRYGLYDMASTISAPLLSTSMDPKQVKYFPFASVT